GVSNIARANGRGGYVRNCAAGGENSDVRGFQALVHGVDHQRVVEVVGEVDDVESALDRDLQQRRCALVKRAGCVDDDVTWMEARLQGVTLFVIHLSVRLVTSIDSSRTEG